MCLPQGRNQLCAIVQCNLHVCKMSCLPLLPRLMLWLLLCSTSCLQAEASPINNVWATSWCASWHICTCRCSHAPCLCTLGPSVSLSDSLTHQLWLLMLLDHAADLLGNACFLWL
jgi:hypothetical protein